MNNLDIIDNYGLETLRVISKADKFNKWMYQSICPHLKGHILEIGSGIGNISAYFVRSNALISLSDVNPYYIQQLKKRFEKSRQVQSILSVDLLHPRFKEIYADLKEKFDAVFLLNVLEHLKDDQAAIANCRFLLKPNGTLLILVPAYAFLFSNMDKVLGHYRRYTKQTLNHLLLLNQFRVAKSFYFNSLGLLGWLYGKWLKLKTIPEGEMNLFNKVVILSKWMDKLLLKRVGLSVITVAQK